MKLNKYYILYAILWVGLFVSFLPIIVTAKFQKGWKQGNGYFLNHIDSIIADNDGRLYCSSMAAHLIQVYDVEGNILYAFDVDTTGAFSMQLIGDNIRIETARGLRQIDYSKDGVLLEEKDIPDGIFARSLRKRASVGDVTFIVKNYPWDSGFKILKCEKGGKSSVLVQTHETYNKVTSKEMKFFGVILFTILIVVLKTIMYFRSMYLKDSFNSLS